MRHNPTAVFWALKNTVTITEFTFLLRQTELFTRVQ